MSLIRYLPMVAILLGASNAAAQESSLARSDRDVTASVPAEVLVVLAKEEPGEIDRELKKLTALRRPPFNSFRSMQILSRPKLTLTPGKDADIIMLRTDAINVLPVNNAYGAIVLGMDTSNVDSVFIAGKARKRGGRLVDVDLARIRRLAEESRDYVVSRAGWPQTLFGGYLPGH